MQGLGTELLCWCAQVNKSRIPLTDNAIIEQVGSPSFLLTSTSACTCAACHLQLASSACGCRGSDDSWAVSVLCMTTWVIHACCDAQALGKYGIICIEDLIHEIYTVGPAFKQASNFLWPFKLSAARGGMPKKRLHYIEGGQHGSREQYINNMVRTMN